MTERLSASEIAGEYELEIGVMICRTFAQLDPDAIPAVLVAGHAPFAGARVACKHFLRKHGRNAYYGQVKT